LNELIQVAERGLAFQKIEKGGQSFYENCSILYKKSLNVTPSLAEKNDMIIIGYNNSKGWYEKCFCKMM
jgi:hypothetical protein